MRQVMILGGLLGLSLVASYRTWTAPEASKQAAAGVLVIQADDTNLTSVSWKDETTFAVVAREEDKKGKYFWVDVTEKAKPPAPPAEGEAPPPAEPAADTVSHFLGNETTNEIWTGFTPLLAMRELTLGPDADLAAYGLDKPQGTIEVVKGSETFSIEVGGESFGTKDRYVRYNGKVWLLDDKILRPLQFAKTRLVERRLFPAEDKKIEKIAVSYAGKDRAFVQKNVDDPSKTHWADAANVEKKDSEATTWIGKLLRLRLKGFVAEAELKGKPEPVFSFQVLSEKTPWTVEVSKTGEGDDTTWYARADFTRGWVELTRSLIQDPVDDLAQLFDGQDAPEEPEPAEGAPAAPGGAPGAPAAPGGAPGAPAAPGGAPAAPAGAPGAPAAPAAPGAPPAGAPPH